MRIDEIQNLLRFYRNTNFERSFKPRCHEVFFCQQDALLKTKSKDDITRKLMQRMKEKKQLGDADDASPFTRTKSVSFEL